MEDARRTLEVRSPATGQPLGAVAIAGPEEIRRAIERARAAQASWGALPMAERLARLGRLRERLVERAGEVARLLVDETGKPLFEAWTMEVMSLLELLAFLEAQAERILTDEVVPLRLARHRRSVLRYAPRGVVAVLAPWNFPLAIGGSEALQALAAGNAVVWKPSEYAPLSALLFQEIACEAGLFDGLLEVLPGDASTGQALLQADVDYVSFTGSTTSGREVARRCGERLIPCRLELGGKASAVVLDDADLGRTAPALVWGAFANAGQLCAAVQRAFVSRAVLRPLLAKVRAEVGRLKPGDPRQPDTEVGRLCPPFLAEQIRDVVLEALGDGARLEAGEPPEPGSHRVRPLVLSGVRPEMRVVREEVFGPVLALVEVGFEAEAIERVNALDDGLAAYVFTENKDRGWRVASLLRAGTVMVNDVVWSYGMPETPWHGLKASGLGVTHGREGLRGYCELRHVSEERMRVLGREAWWFPYSERKLFAVRQAARARYGGSIRKRVRALFDVLLGETAP